MPMSIQIKASIIQVAGQWAFERARMLQEESSRKPATKSFEDLVKEHFNDITTSSLPNSAKKTRPRNTNPNLASDR